MQSRFIHFAVWIAAGLAGLLSCVEINEELGKEYIPTRHLYDVYTDTIFLKEIRMEIADSLSGYSSSRMTIGTVRDDLFGLTTRECAFPLIPVSPNMDFGDNPKCTQFHFSAVRDTLSWPDENQKNIIQNINVFKLDKEIGEKAGYISGKNELQIGERVAPIFSYYGQDSLSFDFDRSFGDEYIAAILDMLDDPDKTGLDSVGNYVKSLPGIYITVDAPASYGGRINMFDIPIEVTEDYYISGNYAELKFRSDYGNRKDVDSSFLFFFGAQEMQIYQDRQSSYSTLIPTSQYVLNLAESEELQQGGTPDKIYVEGACGVKPVVSSREIHESLLEKFGEEGIDPEAVIIHKATIVLPYDYQTENYDKMYLYPDRLSPTCRLSLEDEDVPARTSFALSMDAMPLSMTIGRHRLSLGIRGMLVSDSIKWRQRYLLGSTRAALLASYSIRLADWEVYADLGAGYGQVNGQDISFAYLEAGAGFWYRMTEWMAFGLGYEGLWRREYFDNIISASIRVMLPEGIVGGEA